MPLIEGLNSGADQTHHLAYQINRSCNYNDASRSCQNLRALQSRCDVRDYFDLTAGSDCRLLNLLRRRRPWIFWPRGYHPFREWKQNLRHLRDCLVPHRAENKYQPTVFIALRKGGTQGPGSRRIMRNVEHKLRPALSRCSVFCRISCRDYLKSARPACFADAPLDRSGENSAESLPA